MPWWLRGFGEVSYSWVKRKRKVRVNGGNGTSRSEGGLRLIHGEGMVIELAVEW